MQIQITAVINFTLIFFFFFMRPSLLIAASLNLIPWEGNLAICTKSYLTYIPFNSVFQFLEFNPKFIIQAKKSNFIL